MGELGATSGAALWQFAGLRGTGGRCSSSGQSPAHSRWGPGAVASALIELLLGSPLGDAGSGALREEFAWCSRRESACRCARALHACCELGAVAPCAGVPGRAIWLFTRESVLSLGEISGPSCVWFAWGSAELANAI